MNYTKFLHFHFYHRHSLPSNFGLVVCLERCRRLLKVCARQEKLIRRKLFIRSSRRLAAGHSRRPGNFAGNLFSCLLQGPVNVDLVSPRREREKEARAFPDHSGA